MSKLTNKERYMLLEQAITSIFQVEDSMPMDEIRQEGYRIRISINNWKQRINNNTKNLKQ